MPALLTTRCSHCSTLFRVTPAQLQAHGGQVRCGRCMRVFNALGALAPETTAADPTSFAAARAAEPLAESAAAPAEFTAIPSQADRNDGSSLDFAASGGEARAVTDSAVPSADNPATITVAEEAAAAGSAAQGEGDGETAVGGETEAEAATEAAAKEVPAEVGATVASDAPEVPPDAAAESGVAAADAAAIPAVDGESNPFMAPPPDQAADRRRRHFAAGGFALALLLAAQAVFFYRSDIAARHGPARQWLGALCAAAGCKVSLPQRPQSVLIEASDLQAGDASQQGRIQLTATLRNHAGHDVGYPALDLVLTNANDHALARRVFLPAEYLGNGRDPEAGLAANAEMTVRLVLDTGNLGASGFRLAVLAAPQP